MPSINSIKQFEPASFYHVYNRGVNKDLIFFEPRDYYYFRYFAREVLRKNSLVKIEAFALMPNHFHFLLYQNTASAMTQFMKSLQTRYVMYCNKNHQRVGTLFQGCYRASLIRTTGVLQTTQDYILKNPHEAGLMNWEHVGLGSQL